MAKLKKHINVIIFSMITVAFLLILLLNLKTPLLADDFYYAFVQGTNHKLANLVDVFNSQYTHYFNWGGRSIVHAIAQIFLLVGKPAFNIVNSIVYILLILLVCANVNVKNKYVFAISFVFVNLLIWFFVPEFGQDILWLVGGCNYLWGTFFVVLNLYIYRKHLETPIANNLFKCIGMFILGFISGWTNENTSIAMIATIVMFMILYKIKKIKIPAWSIVGLIGGIIGCLFMLLAPGNFIRSSAFTDDSPLIIIWLNRVRTISVSFYNYLLPIMIIFAVFLCINIYLCLYKNINFYVAMIYFISSLVAAYSMILSPYFPARAWFGVIILFILSIGSLYTNLDYKDKLTSLITLSLLIISLPAFIYSYGIAYYDISKSYNIYQQRESYIEEQKSLGNLDVVCPGGITVHDSRHNPILSDISEDKDFWINGSVAKYYGLNSIRIADK